MEDLFNQKPNVKQFQADKKFDLTGNNESPKSENEPNFDDIFGNNSKEKQYNESPTSSHKLFDSNDYQTPQLEVERKRKD